MTQVISEKGGSILDLVPPVRRITHMPNRCVHGLPTLPIHWGRQYDAMHFPQFPAGYDAGMHTHITMLDARRERPYLTT